MKVSLVQRQQQQFFLTDIFMKQKYGKYQAKECIGQGSFGKVYLALDSDQNKVALKCISKRGRSRREIASLKTQTELLTKVNHENIIALKQCLENTNEIIVVMEYAGNDLSELLKKENKLSDQRIRLYARQVLKAMLYLKKENIVHRDLKPQNILLENNIIKICDFGFAKQMSASTNFLRSVKGTPLYIAPQILNNKPQYNNKVDVWSFGIILYEMATGRTPFYATTIQNLTPKIKGQPVKFPSDMSLHLKNLIDGMLQKNQKMRFSWQQVQDQKFFTQYPEIPFSPIILDDCKKAEVENAVKWQPQVQCAYVQKVTTDFDEGKLSVKDLKYDEDFSLRMTRLMGEVCLDRFKVPCNILLKVVRLIIKLAMQKSEIKENQDDITKNRVIMTAIVTLAQEENNEELLEAEMELIGFLLKQNFNRINIDTDHDQQIIAIIAKKLAKKQPGKTTTLCIKVLGILTSQAVMTLSSSEEYFHMVSEEKIVTRLADCYFALPSTQIVLQCLQKFVHPRIQHNSQISYKTQSVFKSFKEEVAEIFTAKGFINQEPLLSRTWHKSLELEIHCEILFQCLTVSCDMRNQFMKHNYWEELISKKNTQLYYLAFTHLIIKHTGRSLLSKEAVNKQIAQEQCENNLIKVFLIQAAYHRLKVHGNSNTKIQKVRSLLNSLLKMLTLDPAIKKKHCFELTGSLSRQGEYLDDILIDIVVYVAKELKNEQNIKNQLENIIAALLSLPLNQNHLLEVLEVMKILNLDLNESQTKNLMEYLSNAIKKDTFEQYLSIYPANCRKLMKNLIDIKLPQLEDDIQNKAFSQLVEQNSHNFIKIIFSQQISNEQMVESSLKLVNRIFSRIPRAFEFLSQGAFQIVKRFMKGENESFTIQIITFCSQIARYKEQCASQVIKSGIIEICYGCLTEGSQILGQKTLHLIGNLSKYNAKAFTDFKKYKIIQAISNCINKHRNNQRVLKNTIYAVGNISFYSQQFATEMKPIIKTLTDGLIIKDKHLLLNTLSTISNLLRHGPAHLSQLIESGVLAKIIEIYPQSVSGDMVNYFNNVFKKALMLPEFSKEFDRAKLKSNLDRHKNNPSIGKDMRGYDQMARLLSY